MREEDKYRGIGEKEVIKKKEWEAEQNNGIRRREEK